MCLKIALYSLIGQPDFNLSLSEAKTKFSAWSITENASFISFHGGILVYILRKISLKQATIYLPKSNKNTVKNAEATSVITWLLASLDIL